MPKGFDALNVNLAGGSAQLSRETHLQVGEFIMQKRVSLVAFQGGIESDLHAMEQLFAQNNFPMVLHGFPMNNLFPDSRHTPGESNRLMVGFGAISSLSAKIFAQYYGISSATPDPTYQELLKCVLVAVRFTAQKKSYRFFTTKGPLPSSHQNPTPEQEAAYECLVENTYCLSRDDRPAFFLGELGIHPPQAISYFEKRFPLLEVLNEEEELSTDIALCLGNYITCNLTRVPFGAGQAIYLTGITLE